MIDNDLTLDELNKPSDEEQLQDNQLEGNQLEDDQQDIIISDPLLESEVDPASAVYSVKYLKEEFCGTETETMTIIEFNSCSTYWNVTSVTFYSCLIIGILIGFIFGKSIADGWRSAL